MKIEDNNSNTRIIKESNLKLVRKMYGLTVQEMADKLGIIKTTYLSYETLARGTGERIDRIIELVLDMPLHNGSVKLNRCLIRYEKIAELKENIPGIKWKTIFLIDPMGYSCQDSMRSSYNRYLVNKKRRLSRKC